MKLRPAHVAVKNALAIALGVLAPAVANAQTGTTGTTNPPPPLGTGGLGASSTTGTPPGGTTTTTTTTGNTAPTTAPLSATTTTTTTFVTPAVVEPVVRPPEPTAPLPSLPPPISAVAPGPSTVRLHDFMDTRLTWTFGDDDFLHKTGELIPLSPTFSVGERPQYRLFFDNLNSRFTGRENITHLVMYKKLPGFIENLTTEAALVLRFDLGQLAAKTGNLNSALYDTGSYLRLFYQTGANEKTGLSACSSRSTPIASASATSTISRGAATRVPASRVSTRRANRFRSGPLSVYAGFKTASIVVPLEVLTSGADVEEVRVDQTNYSLLGGVGVDSATPSTSTRAAATSSKVGSTSRVCVASRCTCTAAARA